MNFINFCTSTIKYSFYALFFFVPLVFAGNTSELFELNKMWVAWILAIVIGLAWFSKMLLDKKIFIQRTPLDIPILLFLASQTISTIFSLDPQVSWWGYYSRFNGGLLSTITYIFLYYAFVSNLSLKHVFTVIKVTIAGGIVTALWGLPSHYGSDPTCLVFRGTFDTSCWTDAFKPTVRVFSTLGQPAWFAAYLVALIPVVLGFALSHHKNKIKYGLYLIIAVLFYANLIFTHTRAGDVAFVVTYVIFWAFIYLQKLFTFKIFVRNFIVISAIFLLSIFVFGSPIDSFNKFTLPGLMTQAAEQKAAPAPAAVVNTPPAPQPQAPVLDTGITDSGNIRLYVWQGAVDAWKSSPLFGTGVETFAFAYYKFRPTGHNLTSEWDYLYNKAHNEYLNYLTTTGLFGLGSYLAFIGLFLFMVIKPLVKPFLHGSFASALKPNTEALKDPTDELLILGLVAGWISILITNFFGFSVVIINLFLFFIPLFVLLLKDAIDPKKLWEFSFGTPSHSTNPYQWTTIAILTIIAGSMIISLSRYWYADTKYALGANLNRVGSYQEAYPLLLEASMIKSKESVYKDELSINVAVLAAALAQQKDTENSIQFANNAIQLSNQVIESHPNNVVYWKNRVRLFYTLAQGDPAQQLTYFQEALRAIEKAHELAPTDAKIMYNLGVLYGQTGNIQKGVEVISQAIALKPDYRDPYFALGLFYRQLAVNENNQVVNPEMNQKAIEVYQFILKNFGGKDPEVEKSLQEWGAN
jgi:putative inorganic carbon (hco3(-)) transporter